MEALNIWPYYFCIKTYRYEFINIQGSSWHNDTAAAADRTMRFTCENPKEVFTQTCHPVNSAFWRFR